jgi:hypothetical protein
MTPPSPTRLSDKDCIVKSHSDNSSKVKSIWIIAFGFFGFAYISFLVIARGLAEVTTLLGHPRKQGEGS